MLPRYDLRNPVYFVERLNIALHSILQSYRNAYVLDLDGIVASMGRQYFQDDVLWTTSHGGWLSDFDYELDAGRLQPVKPASEYFELRTHEYHLAIWAELRAMFRTARQLDAVKIVIVDLDDTLWRGVVVEEGAKSAEGWPEALVEALLLLKRRGVLLAIVSNNDESKIRELWPSIWHGKITLEDFAMVRINWRPKVENIEAVLSDANLLPRSAVFIDDNPVERAAVVGAFASLRTLGADLYQIRRILLWAPETQVAQVTAESVRRTEMVQAQVAREANRATMSRKEFLAALELKVRVIAIRGIDDEKFERAFELLNKSNQFNTNGVRWTLEECLAAFAAGATVYAFEVEDRYTAYGLAGVVWVRGETIDQFVMSCRVVGLGVEPRVLEAIVADRNPRTLRARYAATDANHLCSDLYERLGFAPDGEGNYHLDLQAPQSRGWHLVPRWRRSRR